jgi:hypothetical protein
MRTARLRSVRILFSCIACFAGLGLLSSAQESPPRSAKSELSFDAPLKKDVVDNGLSPYYDPGRNRRNELSCYFYSTFVVKQYDEGQKGSEWLAIGPVEGRTQPPCTLSHAAGEKVITASKWSGYFMGAKGRLAFFSAADETNEGMPFVVYDSQTVTKVFEDSYHDTTIFNRKVASSPFNHMRVFEGTNEQVSLKYLRVVEANCDLHTEGSSCWEPLRKSLELQTTQIPVCTGYKGISTSQESAVAYPVEVILFPKPIISTIPGPVRRWPVD